MATASPSPRHSGPLGREGQQQFQLGMCERGMLSRQRDEAG